MVPCPNTLLVFEEGAVEPKPPKPVEPAVVEGAPKALVVAGAPKGLVLAPGCCPKALEPKALVVGC